MVTAYNVVSADGYITAKDGSEDFIPDEVWDDFVELCAQNDAVVMGRKSYNAIQGYGEALLKKIEDLPVKRVVVSRDKDFKIKNGYIVVSSPEEALRFGEKVLVSSGPSLNSYLLKHGLIDQMVLNTLSENVGDGGLKPFSVDIRSFTGQPISEEERAGRRLFTYVVIK